MRESVDVSTKATATPHEPLVTTTFEYDIPDSLAEAQARFPAVPDSDGNMVDPVYALWRKQFVVAIQAPSRKVLTEAWEKLSPADQMAAMTAPDSDEGKWTAVLPADQQKLVQAHMDKWVLGERAPRQRVVYTGDPVKAVMEGYGSMDEAQKSELAQFIAQQLGIKLPA